jgi:predicted  nucleic acid-binding Zn-ribbon protein
MEEEQILKEKYEGDLEETRSRIEEIKIEIKDLEDRKKDLENGDDTNYDDFLNDCNPMIKIGSLEYTPSEVLKNVDEVAYDCGYDDYCSQEISDIEDQTEELEHELEELMEGKYGTNKN